MSFKTIVQNGDFRKVWLAQLVSGFGDRIHEIALLFIVFERTGDPILVAVTAAASVIPEIVLSLPAGAAIDRLNRKWVLVVVAGVRGGSVLAIPLLAGTGLLVPAVIGVAAVAGAAESFASPARNAIRPNVVDESQLDAANSLSQMTDSILRFMYAAGGLLIALVGVEGAFYIDAASFLVAAVVLGTLPESVGRTGETKASDVPSIDGLLTDAKEGVVYVIDNTVLLSLVTLSGLLSLLMAPLGVVIPFYSEAVLGGTTALIGGSTAVEFGVLYASIYVGVFVGGICVEALGDVLSSRRGAVIIGGTFFIGVDLVLAGKLIVPMNGELIGSIIVFVILGICFAFVQIPVTTLAQLAVPDDRRGKVFSILKVPALVGSPLGIGIAGVLLATSSVFNVLVVMGGSVLVVTFVLALTPLRSVRYTESTATP